MTGNSNPIAHIVGRFGGQTAFAKAIGKAQGTVWEWITNHRVPSQHIPMIIDVAAQQEPPILLEANDFFPPAGGTAVEIVSEAA